MFDAFANKITDIFDKMKRSGVLKDADVDAALREIRIALLEADVSLEIARKFIADVKEKAIGQNIIASISPAQTVIKIVHDYLVELLGESSQITIGRKPYKIMLIGLQGAGKTTTAAKLANFFATKHNKKVAMASTDTSRPAAIKQLNVLSQKVRDAIFVQDASRTDASFQSISKEAIKLVGQENADIFILDTAGRLHVDEIKMHELIETQKIINPDEIFLVVDIMTGQDAINIAKKFSESLKITGIILTRVDGDARGGVALSMKAITGCDIKFLCVGENINDIEFFDPHRIADRLLGMGDVVSLVEKAQENFSQKDAEDAMKKMQSGVFTFDDLAAQMEKMSQMGGLKTILKMLPQQNLMSDVVGNHEISDKIVLHNIAIIRAMTKNEKKNYKIINGSRRKRIAKGSGTTIQEVNKLIKQYESALAFFKQMKKSGGLSKMISMMRR